MAVPEGEEGAQTVSEYRRPGSGEDPDVLRCRGRATAGIERAAGADARGLRASAPEELRSDVQERTGGDCAGTAARRGGALEGTPAAARAREDALQGQESSVSRVPGRGP